MLTPQSREILDKRQVRKSVWEKREFRAWLRGELEAAGWPVGVEGSFLSGHNVIAGDPDRAEVFFTAHDDTQAVLPFPNFITPRNMGVCIAFQALIVLGLFAIVALVEGVVISAARVLPPEDRDKVSFCRSCRVCALKKGRFGYNMDRIHTSKDTVLMEENIAILRSGCLSLVRALT